MSFRATLGLLIACVVCACFAGDGSPQDEGPPLPSPSREWDQYVDTLGSLTLDEPEGVVNVNPAVRMDPRGGFIVIDGAEHQVRLYARDGSLKAFFGQEGDGPGEFKLPVSARRDPSGRIATAEYPNGELTFWSADGDSALHETRLSIMPLQDILPVGDSGYLVMGRGTWQEPRAWIHRWSSSGDTLARHFFTSPLTGKLRAIGRSLGDVDFDRRADTLAVTFSLADTVFLFTERDGRFELTERVPVPFTDFTVTYPGEDARTDAMARNEWLEQITMIDDIFWLPDGTFLIQSGRRQKTERQQGLLWMTRTGDKIFEASDTPELLTATQDTLFFHHPDHLEPNQWLVATIDLGER